jgi:uncharacterized protein (TIGR02996 family)
MTDREALLAAIRAAPDDDLPRLIFADWIEENPSAALPEEQASVGARAAFIRAQIEAARAEPHSPAARAAEERAAALLTDDTRDAWSAAIRHQVLDYAFHRGFVEHVTVNAAVFAEIAKDLFESEPIRSLRLVRPAPSRSEYEVLLQPLFEVPQLAQLRALDLQSVELLHDDCMNLAESPHLAQLTDLCLRDNPIFPPWLNDVLASDLWPSLTALDLSEVPHLGPTIARTFSKLEHRRFRKIDFSGVVFRSNELHQTLASECLADVEELHLRWDGAAHQAGALTHLEMSYVLPWSNLRVLNLEGQGIGSEGVREIVANSHAAKLRWLNIARNYIGPEGVDRFCRDPDIELYHLDVRNNGLGPRDIAALKRRFPAARIVA